MYITYIIGASVVLEFVYGKVGDSIFNSINKGVSLAVGLNLLPWAVSATAVPHWPMSRYRNTGMRAGFVCDEAVGKPWTGHSFGSLVCNAVGAMHERRFRIVC